MSTNPVRNIILFCIRGYQRALSPLLGPHCRFTPTCSAYAYECFQTLPLPRAFARSMWRILRCQPFCRGGYDPVDKTQDRSAIRP